MNVMSHPRVHRPLIMVPLLLFGTTFGFITAFTHQPRGRFHCEVPDLKKYGALRGAQPSFLRRGYTDTPLRFFDAHPLIASGLCPHLVPGIANGIRS
ncbi:hypothetical protein F5148DRAFT_557452 [Russula earlei]|uniref:Uncharacterized protein n=1 Tax=Russula earlei TaxID=71964 RepID=A0ACC0UG53_9AGAM|nr:hypothetical protein F5148DRAFT_557452 [Russula earlei]